MGSEPVNTASDKQQRFALSLLKQVGVSADEDVDAQSSRKWGLPRGDTVREAVASLSVAKCSELIDRLKGE